MRNKAFGEAFAEFTSKSLDERQKLENDLFVPYTDIHIPPSELFTEKLLVARHSKLCLGQNASGKITFMHVMKTQEDYCGQQRRF